MGETVLITGATGFLGSYLVHELLQDNYRVIVLKRSTSDTWRIDDILERILCYDIDKTGLEMAFTDQHIDVVIHTACCYGRDNEKASTVMDTNVMYGLKLFELTDKFNTDTFFNTDTLLQKYLNTYSLSKKHLVDWLKQLSGKVRVINMKLEHIYGPQDDTKKFVPWIMEQFIQNKDKIELTEGKQERDFVFVTDVVSAYLTILKQRDELAHFTEFDVGTGEPVTVRQFVTELAEQYKNRNPANNTVLEFGSIPYRENEMMGVTVDISLLKNIGWKPKVSFTDGISMLMPPPQ
ncbi:MAG: NAD-dependent epimerase/dehydratase [Treponema sp.]|nr:NAD-dependent epimerase/dehydratase [Treponema sp.]